MAAPATEPAPAKWQPPQPGPGVLERAFGSLSPAEQTVLDAITAFPRSDKAKLDRNVDDGRLAAAITQHSNRDVFTRGDDVVLYQWQVGRFLRHAADQGHVAALRKLAYLIRGTMDTTELVFLCLEFSLHPDKAAAVRLFKDVIAALPRDELRAWTSFVPGLLGRSRSLQWGPDRRELGETRAVRWTEWIREQEFLAKVEKSLAVGSPFAIDFDGLSSYQLMSIPFALLRVIAYAFIQHDRSSASKRDTVRRIRQEVHAHAAFKSAAYDFDADACATLLRHLDHFVQLRWPTTNANDNDTQTDVIKLLANHLARSQIGDAHAIPHIMDFVRHVPSRGRRNSDARDTSKRAYLQNEFNVAHAAVGSAQLANAKAIVASSPSSVPLHASRPRDDDETAAAAAKRRA